MDEQQMRALATEACKRYAEDLADQRRRLNIEEHTHEESTLKLKGLYRKPLTNEWLIHFNSKSVMFNENWEVRYMPKPGASDEEHIEGIKNLMHARRELR